MSALETGMAKLQEIAAKNDNYPPKKNLMEAREKGEEAVRKELEAQDFTSDEIDALANMVSASAVEAGEPMEAAAAVAWV